MTAVYHVTWQVDIDDAHSPQEAAEKALAILRDPKNMSLTFAVDGHLIDLTEGKQWRATWI